MATLHFWEDLSLMMLAQAGQSANLMEVPRTLLDPPWASVLTTHCSQDPALPLGWATLRQLSFEERHSRGGSAIAFPLGYEFLLHQG